MEPLYVPNPRQVNYYHLKDVPPSTNGVPSRFPSLLYKQSTKCKAYQSYLPLPKLVAILIQLNRHPYRRYSVRESIDVACYDKTTATPATFGK